MIELLIVIAAVGAAVFYLFRAFYAGFRGKNTGGCQCSGCSCDSCPEIKIQDSCGQNGDE